MDVLEVMFTTWVGWPIYTSAAFLFGVWAWEAYDDRAQERQSREKARLDVSYALKNAKKRN